jgi:hypothetical protein
MYLLPTYTCYCDGVKRQRRPAHFTLDKHGGLGERPHR